MFSELIEALAITLLESVSGLTTVTSEVVHTLFRKKRIVSSEKQQQEVLSEKITRLTTSLHESAQLMNEIEIEFAKQKRLADEWEEKADMSKVVAELHQNEINAVARILGTQLEEEGKKSDRKALRSNIIFCILGIIGGYVISKILP